MDAGFDLTQRATSVSTANSAATQGGTANYPVPLLPPATYIPQLLDYPSLITPPMQPTPWGPWEPWPGGIDVRASKPTWTEANRPHLHGDGCPADRGTAGQSRLRASPPHAGTVEDQTDHCRPPPGRTRRNPMDFATRCELLSRTRRGCTKSRQKNSIHGDSGQWITPGAPTDQAPITIGEYLTFAASVPTSTTQPPDDSDGDTVSNAVESAMGTNANAPDSSHGDGRNDADEPVDGVNHQQEPPYFQPTLPTNSTIIRTTAGANQVSASWIPAFPTYTTLSSALDFTSLGTRLGGVKAFL